MKQWPGQKFTVSLRESQQPETRLMNPSVRPAFVAATLLAVSAAAAQDYPARAVRLIVPFPPGGSTDLVARVIAQKLSEKWSQQVIVDNRPGANGMIGADIVAKANPDGYSVVMGTIGPMAINASLYKMPYDIARDFAPITYTANVDNVLVVNPAVPAKSVKELIALAQAKPATLTFGSSGTGGAPHMAFELFKLLTKTQITHIPYKGGGPAMVDLMGGQITGSFASMPSSIPFIKTGKLRALGVSSPKRSSAAPDVPTIAEAGVPGFAVLDWQGLFTTAKAPQRIIDAWNAEVIRILALPDVVERLTAAGCVLQTSTPKAWGDFVRSEIDKWARVVKQAGVKVE
jgi:tripartite-type tricarboxylate transporter receptor subunit TctC